MPKADSTELVPKKSAYRTLRDTSSLLEGFWFLSAVPAQQLLSQLISLVRLPSGGLGLQNAKIARLLLPGASNPAFLVPLGVGIQRLLMQASILIYPNPHHLPTASAHARRESEKPAGDYRENAGGSD